MFLLGFKYLEKSSLQVILVIKNLPVNAGDIRDVGSISGSGRSTGGGQGNPLQYCCLENPMDRILAGYSLQVCCKESDTTEMTQHARTDHFRQNLIQFSIQADACIYGILKDGNDNPICRTEKETQMYRTDFWTLWEKARVG